MKFSDAYKKLLELGMVTLAFKTGGGDYVDVWPSELKSGARKGERVIRIQWANSTSTLDEWEWNDIKKSLLMRNMQMMIVHAMK